MVKKVFIFLGGAVTGAASCYFYLNKRYTDKLNAEIESLRTSYNDIFEKQAERIKKAETELEKGISSIDVVEHVKEEGADTIALATEDRINYASFSKNVVAINPEAFHDKSSIKEPEPRDIESLHPMDSDEDEGPEYAELTQDEEGYIQGSNLSNEHAINRNDKPKLIKYEDYGDDGTLKQATLLYFVDNDILTTENEEEIIDPEKLVGDCLDKFHFRTNDDEDTIYVRNSKLGYDYTITKVFDSYSPRDI